MNTHNFTGKPRKVSSFVIGMLIIFSGLTAMNFISVSVLAEYHSSDWEITDHQWRENVNITLDECDIIIKNGGTLTFNNSVILDIICPNPGDYGITIESGGKFEINSNNANTKIMPDTLNPTRTYHFQNSGTIDFLGATVERVYGDPDNSVMGGIVNEPGSVCELENCKLYDSDTHGICMDNADLTITGSDTRICPWEASENDGCGIWINGS